MHHRRRNSFNSRSLKACDGDVIFSALRISFLLLYFFHHPSSLTNRRIQIYSSKSTLYSVSEKESLRIFYLTLWGNRKACEYLRGPVRTFHIYVRWDPRTGTCVATFLIWWILHSQVRRDILKSGKRKGKACEFLRLITICLLLRTLHRHALCETHCTDNGNEKWTGRGKREIWFVGEIKEGDRVQTNKGNSLLALVFCLLF